jgi:hypothetical protein
MGEKRTNCKTLIDNFSPQNFNIFLEMFEPFENPNHIIVKNVCVFNSQKRNKTFNTNVNCKFQDV